MLGRARNCRTMSGLSPGSSVRVWSARREAGWALEAVMPNLVFIRCERRCGACPAKQPPGLSPPGSAAAQRPVPFQPRDAASFSWGSAGRSDRRQMHPRSGPCRGVH